MRKFWNDKYECLREDTSRSRIIKYYPEVQWNGICFVKIWSDTQRFPYPLIFSISVFKYNIFFYKVIFSTLTVVNYH